jgi:prolyl oligopeptidase
MRYLLPLALFILLFHSRVISQTQSIAYPYTSKGPISDDYFGTVVNDPYRWLEADTSTQTKEWIKQQNDLSEKYLKKLLNKYPFKNQLRYNSYIYFGSTHKEGKFFVDFIFSDETKKRLPFS